jgi:hypothetical protein
MGLRHSKDAFFAGQVGFSYAQAALSDHFQDFLSFSLCDIHVLHSTNIHMPIPMNGSGAIYNYSASFVVG